MRAGPLSSDCDWLHATNWLANLSLNLICRDHTFTRSHPCRCSSYVRTCAPFDTESARFRHVAAGLYAHVSSSWCLHWGGATPGGRRVTSGVPRPAYRRPLRHGSCNFRCCIAVKIRAVQSRAGLALSTSYICRPSRNRTRKRWPLHRCIHATSSPVVRWWNDAVMHDARTIKLDLVNMFHNKHDILDAWDGGENGSVVMR
jgi:hypothetical protein